MNRLILLFPFLLSCMFMNSQKMESTWCDTTLVMDGNSSDWQGMPKRYDAKVKMFYQALNNDKYLYLRYQVPDKMAQMKFIMAGFQLQFLIKKRPKLKASIKFPVLERPKRDQQNENTGGKTEIKDKPNLLNEYLLQANFAEIEGFKNLAGLIQNNCDPSSPFAYGLGGDKNRNMILEVRIPLTELFESGQTIAQMSKTEVKITSNLLALERPSMGDRQGQGGMRQGGRGGMHGGRPGGMGMQGGPEGGGMRQSGNTTDRQSMTTAQSITMTVTLAEGR